MLLTACRWLKLQQGPSAEGAVPKYHSRAASSLPFKRRGYTGKTPRRYKHEVSPSPLYQRLASHNCLGSFLLSPEISGSSSPPSSRREPASPLPQTTGKHSQTRPVLSMTGACSRLSISAQLCVSTQGQAAEMGQLVFGHSRKWEAFWKSITLPTEFPEAELFYFQL